MTTARRAHLSHPKKGQKPDAAISVVRPVRSIAAANRAPRRTGKPDGNKAARSPDLEIEQLRGQIAALEAANAEAANRLAWAIDKLQSVIDQVRARSR